MIKAFERRDKSAKMTKIRDINYRLSFPLFCAVTVQIIQKPHTIHSSKDQCVKTILSQNLLSDDVTASKQTSPSKTEWGEQFLHIALTLRGSGCNLQFSYFAKQNFQLDKRKIWFCLEPGKKQETKEKTVMWKIRFVFYETAKLWI